MAAEAMARLNIGGGGGGLGGAGLGGKKPSPALAAALRMAANKSGANLKDKDKLRQTIANAVKVGLELTTSMYKGSRLVYRGMCEAYRAQTPIKSRSSDT